MLPRTLFCRLTRIRPHTIKPDGWAIAEAETDDGERLVLRGIIGSQPLRRWLRLEVRHQEHPRYGSQWQVIHCEPVLPGSSAAPASALERNLVDLIPGVGKSI